MQHLEVSGAVRHIYIYIYVIKRLKIKSAGASVQSPTGSLGVRISGSITG